MDDDPSPRELPPPDEDAEGERGRATSESISGVPSSVGEPLIVSGTDRYFVPLRLACESKLPRIMEVALACIQKLIAYGYVRGKVVQVGKVRRSMMDVVMETVCACKDQEDELVQLQIVKAVLTAVTSTVSARFTSSAQVPQMRHPSPSHMAACTRLQVSAVHETTLLLAVKTCFYIYLVSRTPVIQTTANATLTQMLNVVFQRLEFGGSASSSSLSVIQRDAFLVFRSLCKLSMKPLPEPLPSDEYACQSSPSCVVNGVPPRQAVLDIGHCGHEMGGGGAGPGVGGVSDVR